MFYKDNYLSHELTEKLKNSSEFIYSYFKKVEYLPYYSLGEVQGLDKKGNIIHTTPIVLKSTTEDNANITDFNAYVTIKGMRSLTPFGERYMLENVQRENSKVQSLNIIPMQEQDFLQKYKFNNKLLKLSHSLLKDFSNVVREGTIFDKYNQEYQYCIIANKDPTIGDTLIIDEIILFAPRDKNLDILHTKTPRVKIGSIKAKYTTKDILENIYFSPFNNSEYVLDTITRVASNIKKKTKKQDLSYYVEKYTNKNIDNTFHYSDHIEQFESEIKNNLFVNVATIDFSYLEDEFKNKGLGYALYFQMAKYLTAKNIEFRQSSLCSDSAQVLWAAFYKHVPQIVSKKLINNKELYFLSVPENYSLEFNNNLPTIQVKQKINDNDIKTNNNDTSQKSQLSGTKYKK